MNSLNRVSLIGNVGRDPDVRYTQSGDAILSFSLATSERWKARDGEWQERTDWHRVDIFGKLASALKDYITKGKKLFVEGRLTYEEWTDKEGNKRVTPKVKVSGFGSNVILLGGRDGEAKQQVERKPVDPDEDVPF